MTIIQSSMRINASADKVWDVVSDLDNEPKFWKGTKEIKNISKEENKVTREITIAFKDSKCMQEVTLEPKRKIQAVFTKGIIEGTKTIELIPVENTTEIEVIWDIKLSGLMGMFTGMVKNTSKTEQIRLLKV